MSGEVTFLPWLRRGLAQALVTPDPLSGGLAGHAGIDAWVDIEQTRVTRGLQLLGPGAVAGLDPAQVLREEPRADSAGVEPGLFAFAELAAPDLPWMYTPARAEAQGRLRPWLVLVVVREQDGVRVESRPDGALPVLRIEPPAAPADELPDLADAAAWAHVQSLVGLDGVEGAVRARTGQVVARLLCPRRTTPDSGWLACLVPAFDAGVARGLRRAQPAGDRLAPAWDLDGLGPAIELPVYHHWRFATGAAGSFEALCRRLQGDGDGAELGLHALDVGDPGLVSPAPKPVLLDMEGPLRTLEAKPRPWPDTHEPDFRADLRKLLDAGAARAGLELPRGTPYDPARHDPVVAPPFYGAQPAGVARVPAKGWLPELNEHPVRRAAAGLGARAVRAAQEALVAAAWEQAGDLRATVSALRHGRLAAEVARSWAERAAALEPADLLALTRPMHAFLATTGTSVGAQLAASDLPAGTLSAAHLRQTRPGTALARDWRAVTGSATARLGADHARIGLDATGDGTLKAALEYAVYAVPAGAWIRDATLSTRSLVPIQIDPGRRAAAELVLERRLARRVDDSPIPRPTPHIPVPPVLTGDDVSEIATTVRRALDPRASVRANLLVRIPTLAAVLPDEGLPDSVPIGPEFTDPLYWELLGLGASWVLPGVETLRRNRVRLVQTDAAFVGAFLVGANHELGRELAWRDYPVDLRATFFRRFWNYIDPNRSDITPVHDWDEDIGLAANVGAGEDAMTVVVVRGDLVRRYPSAHFFLQAADFGEDDAMVPVEGTELEPDFLGALDRDTVFFGFSGLLADEVRGDVEGGDPGWFFVVEEQAGAPRFGLDDAKPAHFDSEPQRWNQLSWGHLVTSQAELDALSHAHAANPRMTRVGELQGSTWGYNAAHMARACWQRPFRMLIHAGRLV